jgi:glycosyltransferase involved in cell wall biosynthesis
MPAVYHASDVVVQTSDNEGTPVSLIEAMAAGLPAVSTDVGGTRSVVAHGETGLLVGRDDHPALVEALRSLCASPTLRSELGCAGRERAFARFGLDRLIADVADVYAAALAGA